MHSFFRKQFFQPAEPAWVFKASLASALLLSYSMLHMEKHEKQKTAACEYDNDIQPHVHPKLHAHGYHIFTTGNASPVAQGHHPKHDPERSNV